SILGLVGRLVRLVLRPGSGVINFVLNFIFRVRHRTTPLIRLTGFVTTAFSSASGVPNHPSLAEEEMKRGNLAAAGGRIFKIAKTLGNSPSGIQDKEPSLASSGGL